MNTWPCTAGNDRRQHVIGGELMGNDRIYAVLFSAFVFPGIGQIVNGQRLKGAAIAGSVIVLAVLMGVAISYTRTFFYETLVWIIMIGLYVYSIVDAWKCPKKQ